MEFSIKLDGFFHLKKRKIHCYVHTSEEGSLCLKQLVDIDVIDKPVFMCHINHIIITTEVCFVCNNWNKDLGGD